MQERHGGERGIALRVMETKFRSGAGGVGEEGNAKRELTFEVGGLLATVAMVKNVDVSSHGQSYGIRIVLAIRLDEDDFSGRPPKTRFEQ